jgi:cell division protein FtsW (lipid II flippase)
LQPDFGSTVICAALMFTMLFVAGARVVYMAALGGIAAVLGGVRSCRATTGPSA